MNLNERFFEAAAAVRERATTFASQIAAKRAEAAKRVVTLTDTLSAASKELGTVARLHGTRLVEKKKGTLRTIAADSKATWGIVSDAGQDVTKVARKTFASLVDAPVAKSTRAARKPRARKSTKAAKAA
jgi:hypothetical protein